MQYIHTCLSLEWTAHLKLKVRFPDRVLTNSWKVMAESPICWWASNLSLRIISFPGEICVINSRLSRANSKSAKGISPNPSGSNRSKSVRHSSLIGGSANSWSGCSSSVYILLKSSSYMRKSKMNWFFLANFLNVRCWISGITNYVFD